MNLKISKDDREPNRLYDAAEIAEYIINYSIQIKKPVSNMKLQKLLFYVQAYFLVTKRTPAFRQELLWWRYGPVIAEIYHYYKIYVNDPIECMDFFLHLRAGQSTHDERNFHQITEADQRLITQVVDFYADWGSLELTRKILDETPWAYTLNEQMSLDAITKFYCNNKNLIVAGSDKKHHPLLLLFLGFLDHNYKWVPFYPLSWLHIKTSTNFVNDSRRKMLRPIRLLIAYFKEHWVANTHLSGKSF